MQVAEPRREESDYCASKTVRNGQATGYRQSKGTAKGAGVGAWLQLALRGALVAACA